MKQVLLWLVSICLTFSLLGCSRYIMQTQPAEPEVTEPEITEPETTEPELTEPEITEPEATEPEITEPEITEPEHSALYIPDVSVEDVLAWFNEVCLDSEFVNGGDPSLVQKWQVPIAYMLHGEPTEEDLTALDGFVQWLNTVEGFPGITQTNDPANANLHIHFTDAQGLTNIMGPDYAGADGGVTFWYMDNAIYDEVICIRTDIDQYVRNSVILEEVYNGLGPVQDTMLRPDSLIYQAYSAPQELTEVDELIIKLLYHPDILCGMDIAQCETVIRALYY